MELGYTHTHTHTTQSEKKLPDSGIRNGGREFLSVCYSLPLINFIWESWALLATLLLFSFTKSLLIGLVSPLAQFGNAMVLISTYKCSAIYTLRDFHSVPASGHRMRGWKAKAAPKIASVPIFLPSSERDLLFRAAKARARISVNAPKESQAGGAGVTVYNWRGLEVICHIVGYENIK